MTAETSNARGETYTFDMIEDAWGDAVPLTKPYFNRFRARLETLRQSAAPPPAAARVDVRGLVTLAEQWERDAGGCRRDGYMDAAVVKENCAFRLRQALGISAIGEALATKQPLAVDEAMTRRIMSEFHANDPGDVWPPEEQGRLRRKALQDAINNVLAQQPAAVDGSDAQAAANAERAFFAQDFYEEAREGKKPWPVQQPAAVGDLWICGFCHATYRLDALCCDAQREFRATQRQEPTT